MLVLLNLHCRTAGHPSLFQVMAAARTQFDYLLKRKHNWIFKQRYHCYAHCVKEHQFYKCTCMFFLQEGWTALSLASWKGRTKIVQILLHAGAKINIQDQVTSKNNSNVVTLYTDVLRWVSLL